MLNYTRHFTWLLGMAAALAVTQAVSFRGGILVWAGLYGAAHGIALAASLRAPPSLWRRAVFVAGGAVLCALSLEWGLGAGRIGVAIPAVGKPVLTLAAAAGLGAVSYGLWIRICFGSSLTPAALGALTLGCIAATLAVFGSRLYLHGGAVWFALAWWCAFSGGLWCRDSRGAPPKAARAADNPLL